MPYAELGDTRLYYEQHGAAGAPPLVLLNGALDTIDSAWGAHLAAFAASHRVLAYEHRGHGRSASFAPGSFSGYAQLAQDLTRLLDALEIAEAVFCGFSDGAITLIEFALAQPARVRALILAGGQHTNDARTLALWEKMTPERIGERLPQWAELLERQHDAHHRPGYWRELLATMRPMWRAQPDYSPEQLAGIRAPTLLIAGERDGFGHPEQQLAMRQAIPGAELCILPRAGHAVQNDAPELFRLIVAEFLARVG
jgi:pimeloyl-ACP methyl ester carboxylesterase